MSRRSQCAWLIVALTLVQMGWPITGFTQGTADDRLRSKVGVVYGDSQNNLLLDIPQSNVRQGARVVIITLPGQSVVCCAEVNKIASAEPGTVQQVIFDDAQSTTYELKTDKKHNDVRFGFGVIDAPGVFSAQAGVVGAQYPLKGSRRWHAYFYLGYEIEPSCVERDLE